jgi:hypothetical protein
LILLLLSSLVHHAGEWRSGIVRTREHRAAGTAAGVLDISGTRAGLLSVVVSAPVSGAGDSLVSAADHSGAIVTGALLLLVTGLSFAFVPVVLFQVFAG